MPRTQARQTTSSNAPLTRVMAKPRIVETYKGHDIETDGKLYGVD